MGAEGRWTIWRIRERAGEQRFGAWNVGSQPKDYESTDLEVEAVPVVPCDDAAVERVARYLHIERFGTIDTAPSASCVDTARAVLRAARG
jgi:hypothetical protein